MHYACLKSTSSNGIGRNLELSLKTSYFKNHLNAAGTSERSGSARARRWHSRRTNVQSSNFCTEFPIFGLNKSIVFMAAPPGNQFWKQRTTHGRDLLFSSPEMLWEEACKYFQWCDEHPLMSYEWNGKNPKKCDLEKMRAYTQKGLCLFLDIDEQTLENYLANKDFFGIVTRIKNIIFTQKFEGAAAGLLNPNIIARELGLVDKQEHDNKFPGKGIKVIFGKKPEEEQEEEG